MIKLNLSPDFLYIRSEFILTGIPVWSKQQCTKFFKNKLGMIVVKKREMKQNVKYFFMQISFAEMEYTD